MIGRDIPTPPAIRKLAVLLGALDAPSAEALLAQLDLETAEQARACQATLHDVLVREQEEVIAEFLGRRPPSQEEASAVEVDVSLARRLADPLDESTSPVRSPADSHRFKPWSNLAPARLGRTLRYEHPQVIAVVLAQLPPAKAAVVLSEFPDDEQAAILQRVARLESPDPALVGEIAAALDARLPQLELGPDTSSQPTPAVQAILAAAPDKDRRRWLAELASATTSTASDLSLPSTPRIANFPEPKPLRLFDGRSLVDARGTLEVRVAAADDTAVNDSLVNDIAANDTLTDDTATNESSGLRAELTQTAERPMIAGRIGEAVSTRSADMNAQAVELRDPTDRLRELVDVARLDDSMLAAVLRAAEPVTVVLALAGAAPEVVAEFRSRWSTREARMLEQQIQRLGRWHPDDARRAQEQLLAVARQVVHRLSPLPPSNGPRRVA